MLRKLTLLAAVTLSGLAVPVAPLQADVAAQSDAGFVVKLTADTTAPADAAWRMLIVPAKWWSSDHTWSHDAANLYLDAQGSGSAA